ncbi:MAG: tetratricopeptide repeat protein [Candidatus Riflebacteria bacterium]|nr:tetratricopeptide repeat protein [Candidatus Riflebacteria bacterium]
MKSMIITPEEIIKKAQKCLKEGRNQTSAFTAMGMAYFEKGLLDKAIFFYGRALETNPHFAAAYAGMGMVYGKKGLVTESIFNLKESIKLTPSCALLYNWLGDAYFDQGRHEEAIREYTKATELDSLDSNAHNDLADAYRMKGNFAAALEHYQKTLKIDPGDTNALLEMAQVLIQLNRGVEAKKLLLDMLSEFADSDDAKTARVVLASLATQDGDFTGAREYLLQAARDFPFNPSIQFHLGLCHLLLEEPVAAQEHLQRALDLDPNNIRAARLMQQLRRRKT